MGPRTLHYFAINLLLWRPRFDGYGIPSNRSFNKVSNTSILNLKVRELGKCLQ
jgi:hypothetical protein